MAPPRGTTPFRAEDDLAFALRLADVAKDIALRSFAEGRRVAAERKADGSPITAVDREIEQTLLEIVQSERPGDAFLGEEVGHVAAAGAASGRCWIVDGIDGTSHFAAGHASGWCTLIALESAGEVTVGVLVEPASRRKTWASAAGAWTQTEHDAEPRRLHVSSRPIELARLIVWAPRPDPDDPRSVLAEALIAHWPGRSVERRTAEHGAILVANGLAEVFIHAWPGGAYDLAAPVAIIEAAGGRASDLSGGRDWTRGAAILTNGVCHERVLQLWDGCAS